MEFIQWNILLSHERDLAICNVGGPKYYAKRNMSDREGKDHMISLTCGS